MERKSIITWRDAIKLAVGIAIGLIITVISMLVFAECNSAIDYEVNRSETWQHRLNSSNSKETLVVSGIEADDYTVWGSDSIGVFKKDEKYGYYNNNTKEIVVPAIYENAWRFSEGLAGVIKDGLLGFINLKGETVIDFHYAYHKSRLHEFIFHWGYCAVPNASGDCGVIDKTGRWVIQPKYNHAEVASSEYAIVAVPNGFKMQLDYDGNIINPYVIDEAERLLYTKNEKDSSTDDYKEYPTSFYKYRVNYNAGLMDGKGHFITKPIYNNVEAIDETLFLATLKDGVSVVVIDQMGNVVNR